jgi:hypothetical protein
MRANRRRLAAMACAAVLPALVGCGASTADALVTTGASAAASVATPHAAHLKLAERALDRLLAGGPVAGHRVDVGHLVRATVCFDGACAHRRVRPDPVCDPSAGACIGTALQAWRRHSFTVEVELA